MDFDPAPAVPFAFALTLSACLFSPLAAPAPAEALFASSTTFPTLLSPSEAVDFAVEMEEEMAEERSFLEGREVVVEEAFFLAAAVE